MKSLQHIGLAAVFLGFLFVTGPLLADPDCKRGLAALADVELENRIRYLTDTIGFVQKHRAEDPAWADSQIKRLSHDLEQLTKWGVTHEENGLLDTDSYKVSQYAQYPPGTTKVFSYIESRGGAYDATVFFGLQYILKKQFSKPITPEMVEQAKLFYEKHGEPFNYEGWMYIAKKLNGRIPLRIRAAPEGTVVPTKNILMSIENTDPNCAWVVGWFETRLMRAWYPTTVATVSHEIRKSIYESLQKTSENPDAEIDFKLQDFGSRGVSSQESAGIGGAAHLVNFKGSDTVAGVVTANIFYNDPMSGFSIPASEHSTMTIKGKAGEEGQMKRMLDLYAKPGAVLACVSDSYNLWHAITHYWGGSLKQQLIDSGATLVVRPDSGDPAPTVLKTLQLLEEKFGSTVNAKGFKVLNHNVRVIQGDGINHESIKEILKLINDHHYSTTNIAFGMGGALLQHPNRDTQEFAMKASWALVDGVEIEVFKDPITAGGKKTSKKGRLDLVERDGKLQTVSGSDQPDSILRDVWQNGILLREDDFSTIRARANPGLK